MISARILVSFSIGWSVSRRLCFWGGWRFFGGLIRKLNWFVLVSFVISPKCSVMWMFVGYMWSTSWFVYLLFVSD